MGSDMRVMRVRHDLTSDPLPKMNSKQNKNARSGANGTCMISPLRFGRCAAQRNGVRHDLIVPE